MENKAQQRVNEELFLPFLRAKYKSGESFFSKYLHQILK